MLLKNNKILIVAFFVNFTNFFCNAAVTIEPLNASTLYGLDNVQIDTITQFISQKASLIKYSEENRIQDSVISDISNHLSEKLKSFSNITHKQELFDQLYLYIIDQKFNKEADFYSLATELANFRNFFRLKSPIQDQILKGEMLYLVQSILEEILYVGYSKFNLSTDGNENKKSWRWIPDPINKEEKPADSSFDLRGMTIRNGDILLSKATGSGSSALISMISSIPHVFSHSTIAIITYLDRKLQLLSPEADIADGVKLRDFGDYKEGVKTRLFVYRLHNQNLDIKEKIHRATEAFIKRMYEITPDPFNKKAFNYDFNLTAGIADSEEAYFCAAIPCRIYANSGLEDSMNPYPKTLWTKPRKGDIREQLYKFLKIPNSPSIAPGDMEENSNFELVGTEIQLHRLEVERIEVAILDSLFDLLEENENLVKELVEKTETLGNEPVTTEQLQNLVKLKILPEAALSKIPDDIKPSQMIFFGYINQVFTPKIEAILMRSLNEKKQQGIIEGPQELRLQAYRIQSKKLSELRQGTISLVNELKKSKKRLKSSSCLSTLS